MSVIGIPQKLLFESLGHTVTFELKDGALYRGSLVNVEDNMNCFMQRVEMTKKDGQKTILQQCYIRGSQIRFVIVPDMLKHSPMFKFAKKNKKSTTSVGLSPAIPSIGVQAARRHVAM